MIDEEAPEWTAQMNAQAVTLKDLPATLQAKLSAGRPSATGLKRVVTLSAKSSL
jgi:hypothetical protein